MSRLQPAAPGVAGTWQGMRPARWQPCPRAHTFTVPAIRARAKHLSSLLFLRHASLHSLLVFTSRASAHGFQGRRIEVVLGCLRFPRHRGRAALRSDANLAALGCHAGFDDMHSPLSQSSALVKCIPNGALLSVHPPFHQALPDGPPCAR